MLNRFGRLLTLGGKAVLGYLVFAVAMLIPKRRGLWLFGAWLGRKYSDNPKYVHRYISERESGIDAVWVTKDRDLYRGLLEQGVAAAYAYSLAGIWLQLRAELVAFTHSVPDEFLAPLVAPWVRRAQMWHGVPIKKIGHDDNTQQYSRLHLRVRALLFPFDLDRCDIVIAASDSDAGRYRSAFNVRPEQIRVTGYPRNDELVRSAARATDGGPRRAIYMPTLRGPVDSEFALLRTSGFDARSADRTLERIGWRLTIKLHPLQRLSAPDEVTIDQTAHIDRMSSDQDIYDMVGAYDAVITDFSGIYFDFMITGKPIVMAPFEIEKYIANDRQLYFRYDEILPDEPCTTWDEILVRLESLPPHGSAPSARYVSLQRVFHRYLDDESSRRVVDELKALTHVA